MDEVRLGLKDNIDLSKYVKMGMNYLQIQEIRFGILSKIDVSKYDKPNIGHKDMREVRRYLERNKPIPLTLRLKLHI